MCGCLHRAKICHACAAKAMLALARLPKGITKHKSHLRELPYHLLNQRKRWSLQLIRQESLHLLYQKDKESGGARVDDSWFYKLKHGLRSPSKRTRISHHGKGRVGQVGKK